MLTRHFLLQSAQQLGVEPKRISEAALDLLGTFQFPGNVRQLENICHWLTVMAPAQVIESKDLPPEVIGSNGALNGSSLVTSLSEETVAPVHAPVLSGDSVLISEPMTAAGSAGLIELPVAQNGIGAPRFTGGWESNLEAEALSLLATDRQDVWDVLTRRFETCLIQAALATTRGRRIEAALKLGIGRNTITRKIQELGIED
jgi:two-component system nitrogen regulation response regulator GlnG